jgi:hypothetical protein
VFTDQPVSVQCLSCGRSGRNRVCPGCVARTDDELTELPSLYAALGDAMIRGSVPVGDRVSGGSRTPPIPVRLEPLSLRAHGGITAMLHSWEDDWRDILGWSARPFRGTVEQSLVGSVKFLRVNLPWCADAHPAPGEFMREVREWSASCRMQVYGPGDTRMIGVCPTVADDGYACGTALWANPYVEKIECRGCRTCWPRTSWIGLASAMRNWPGNNA